MLISITNSGRSKASKTYEQIVREFAPAFNWLDNSIRLTKAIKTQQLPIDKAREELIKSLHTEQAMTSADFKDAEISFESTPHLEHLTGHELLLPSIEFKSAASYRGFTNKIGYTSAPQGVSIPADYSKFLNAVNIEYQANTRPLRVTVYCKEQLPGARPSEQIERHEDGHKIDPYLEARSQVEPDHKLIGEMTAIFSEFAIPDLDRYALNVPEDFWHTYIGNSVSPDLLKLLKINPNASRIGVNDIAEAMTRLVKDLSRLDSNTEIMKMLMETVSVEDLYQKISEKYPSYFQAQAQTTVRANQSETSGLNDQAIRHSLAMYQSFPNSYIFYPRVITGKFINEGYAKQAFGAFLSEAQIRDLPYRSSNDDTRLGSLAIQEFKKLPGPSQALDNTNIQVFNITKRRDSQNHHVTISVSW